MILQKLFLTLMLVFLSLSAADKINQENTKEDENKVEIEAIAPKLQINGYTNIAMGQIKQTNNYGGKGGGPYLTHNTSTIYFTAEGVSSEGFRYKARIAMDPLPQGKSGSYFSQNYIELGSTYGLLQMGNVDSVESAMHESGLNLMNGAGSIDGVLTSMANTATGVIGGVKIYGSPKKATKINLYTPVLSGFQLGISYTPNTNHLGGMSQNNSHGSKNAVGNQSGIYPNKEGAPFGINNIVLSIKYNHEFNDDLSGNVVVSTIREGSRRGNNNFPSNSVYDSNSPFFDRPEVQNVKSYELSGALGYKDFRFAAGYIDNGKSRLPKGTSFNPGDAGKAWNMGVLYGTGPYALSLGYFNTRRKLPDIPNLPNGATVKSAATTDTLTATFDYVVLKGLKLYAEVDLFKSKTDSAFSDFMETTNSFSSSNEKGIKKCSGSALIIGTKLSF